MVFKTFPYCTNCSSQWKAKWLLLVRLIKPKGCYFYPTLLHNTRRAFWDIWLFLFYSSCGFLEIFSLVAPSETTQGFLELYSRVCRLDFQSSWLLKQEDLSFNIKFNLHRTEQFVVLRFFHFILSYLKLLTCKQEIPHLDDVLCNLFLLLISHS